jgi:hypothetical protein
MIAGDSNLIYKAEDKNTPNFNRGMMGRFRNLINDLVPSELPLTGRKFTWSNQQANSILVKLDRVLCTLDWEEMFLNSLLQSLASNDSDHCPLLLGLRDNILGRRRFHFEAFWPKIDGFLEVVSLAWHSVPVLNCPFSTLNLKLKAAAKGLHESSAKKVGNISSTLALAQVLLHHLEVAQDSLLLSSAELWFKINLKKHSVALASLQRTIARLRSRIGWLREGDANTKLFHMHSRFRKKKNFVTKLVSNGVVLSSHDDKANLVDDFYGRLLGLCSDREHTISLENLGIPNFDLSSLDAPFSEKEVWDTICLIPLDQAPGPDGFTGRFYKACWDIIKVDVLAAFSAVGSRRFINFHVLNTAYITLIPKFEGADQVKDFRPISLVHSFAKLLTKLLANCLAGRLHNMVSPNQSAFIKGRFIQDNFMLVQQTTRFLHQHKLPRILLKLDISKAFDSVSWPFLLEVLQHLGFGQILRDVISGLLWTSSSQVLLNGLPGQTIIHRCGLR